jgi:hypothetical protein
MKTGIIKKCKYCGRLFKMKKNDAPQKEYCSEECWLNYYKERK